MKKTHGAYYSDHLVMWVTDNAVRIGFNYDGITQEIKDRILDGDFDSEERLL